MDRWSAGALEPGNYRIGVMLDEKEQERDQHASVTGGPGIAPFCRAFDEPLNPGQQVWVG